MKQLKTQQLYPSTYYLLLTESLSNQLLCDVIIMTSAKFGLLLAA